MIERRKFGGFSAGAVSRWLKTPRLDIIRRSRKVMFDDRDATKILNGDEESGTA